MCDPRTIGGLEDKLNYQEPDSHIRHYKGSLDASSKIKSLQSILQLCGSGKAKADTFLQGLLFQLQDARNKQEDCQNRLSVTSDLEMSTGEMHIVHQLFD